MSASLLSGGLAPASVSFQPTQTFSVDEDGVPQTAFAFSNGATLPNCVLQNASGVQAGQNAITALNFLEPPFPTYASLGNQTQSAFALTVPNGSFGGRTEGALQLISYVGGPGGNVNAFNLTIPKPSLVVGTGDNICLLGGSDQAGTATIVAGALGLALAIANTSVLATSPIQFSHNPYSTLGPVAGAGVSLTITPGVDFTFTIPVASLSDIVIRWFIPRY
jgi:hypothetical protein